ncbi:MAG: transglycosylase SLT domain-containing protein [Muribaculaceae bacterium]|nr:transglycosylase SLT domain-containing protein [Muribaculaceae bacterium]
MKTISIFVIALTLVLGFGCSGRGDGASSSADSIDSLDTIVNIIPDTLRVATLYSPSSYFIYREQQMGYDYELASRFAADKGVDIDIVVAHNLAQAVEMLDSGLVHLIAYEVPVTAEYLEHLVPCGMENITHQVLVQPRAADSVRITDVTQLVGREVYVEKDSRYYYRMVNLNTELGGGIIIKPVAKDTLVAEDLLDMVADGTIPLTVVDSDVASVGRTYYPNLDISLQVSFPQRSAWAVSPSMSWLGDTITQWSSEESPRKEQAALMRRYYEKSKTQTGIYEIDFASGRMSGFDPLFKRYAAEIKWDWRLLSSMGYAESRYDSTQVSWAGARGIMQLMPATARAFGADPQTMAHNEVSVATAVKVINSLESSLRSYVPDADERKKFVIAAYNSGLAHILDAIAIAKLRGMNAQVWDGNVAEALMLKSNPEIYNLPEVRYGFFRGRQTYDYVRTVMACYDKARKQIKP